MNVELDQVSVDQFKEVCAVDESKARQFLNHCDGNLETAVQLFFQTGGTLDIPELHNNVYNEELEIRQRRHGDFQRNVSPPPMPIRRRAPERQGWMDWIVAILYLPVRFTFGTLWELISFFAEFFVGRARPALTDPRGDVNNFLEQYSTIAEASGVSLNFFRGSFDDVMKEAKNSLKMVLVYLHNPSHSATPDFIQNVLHSEQMRSLIDDQGLLVWGVTTSSPQGAAVSAHLRPAGYPFLALLTFKNNKIVPAIKIGGTVDVDTIVVNIRLAIEDHVAQLNILRMQRAHLQENQRIREEQEREYRESAEKDRARIRERKRLESERAEAEERERQKQQQAEDRKQAVASRREQLRESLKDEPTSGELVRIQVRFPCGSRLDRKFNVDDSLEELFANILSHEKCPDFFTAHTTYPRKELVLAPQWYHELRHTQLEADGIEHPSPYEQPKTFREEGLEKSLVVMIHNCLA